MKICGTVRRAIRPLHHAPAHLRITADIDLLELHVLPVQQAPWRERSRGNRASYRW